MNPPSSRTAGICSFFQIMARNAPCAKPMEIIQACLLLAQRAPHGAVVVRGRPGVGIVIFGGAARGASVRVIAGLVGNFAAGVWIGGGAGMGRGAVYGLWAVSEAPVVPV